MNTSPQHPQPAPAPGHRSAGRPGVVSDGDSDGVVSDGVAATNGTYNAVAVFLALIVTAALVYGLVQTSLKATALFTG